MSFLLVSSVGDVLNVRAGEAGWSEAKGRGSVSERESLGAHEEGLAAFTDFLFQ